MYEDKYEQLKKLKKKSRLGGVLIAIVFITYFIVIPFALTQMPELEEKISSSTIFTILYFISLFVIVVFLFIKFCSQAFSFESDLEEEIKTNILIKEMNNAFNNSYKEEDIEELEIALNELCSSVGFGDLNDCFSIKYKNTRIKYADLDISSTDNDGHTTTYFEGSVMEFNLNNHVDGALYITMTEKGLFSTTNCLIDNFVFKKDNKIVVPTNNYLKENIAFKSNTTPTIIEDRTFQETINELITDNEHFIIINNNKLYYFIDNDENKFEIKVKDQQEEIKSEEQIREEINKLKIELDTILRYKEKLNIKEESF